MLCRSRLLLLLLLLLLAVAGRCLLGLFFQLRIVHIAILIDLQDTLSDALPSCLARSVVSELLGAWPPISLTGSTVGRGLNSVRPLPGQGSSCRTAAPFAEVRGRRAAEPGPVKQLCCSLPRYRS
ncbi:uncharacterized protein BJ171DRAFT_513172 [Polychytrium aggregatum]|uniref:uncharacterized protein n=1 Tax=Polychytrium aggregatum TaxID=110093 RepID=UPI0022FDDD14|nr:uncharacterized protein BJ171DRAFT_513172 [Polychytrium aggregatum]KAI9202779.1 hypothetical protein BJ171DRAFT_513172 [Polychytrium aggregatum]